MLDLTPDLVRELTAMVFDYPAPPVQPCDAIFVFGGSHPGLWQTAAQAYHAGLGKTIIATGGYKPGVIRHPAWVDGTTPEAHVIRRELICLGVPGERIVVEDRSTNSLENVLFAKEVYDFSQVRRLLVVCKSYGVGRQCRTLRRHIPASVILIPYPFDTELHGVWPPVTRDTWTAYPEARAYVLAQARKIHKYGGLGHLEPVEDLSPALLALITRADPEPG